MSVITSYPQLVEDDFLRLAAGFTITSRGQLHDAVLHAKHQLTRAGLLLVGKLQKGVTLRVLYAAAKQQHIAESEVLTFLGTLNTFGALERHRTAYQHMVAANTSLRHRLVGIRYAAITRRYPASWSALLAAILHTTKSVGAASCVTIILLMGTNISTPTRVLIAGSLAYLLFIASLYIHEAAHVRLLNKHHIPVAILWATFRIGILHRTTSIPLEKKVALLGPVAGIATCLVPAIGLFATLHWEAALLCCIIAGFHCGSLLPWYADGATLFTNNHTQQSC